LILTDWQRTDGGTGENRHTIVVPGKIKNTGRGPAQRIEVHFPSPDGKTYGPGGIPNKCIGFLGANDVTEVDPNVGILVWWTQIESGAQIGKKLHPIVSVYYWDTENVLYETRYRLWVFEKSEQVLTPNFQVVAPGVGLTETVITMPSVWSRRLRTWLGRIWSRAKGVPYWGIASDCSDQEPDEFRIGG
jgi:hypothetical protein